MDGIVAYVLRMFIATLPTVNPKGHVLQTLRTAGGRAPNSHQGPGLRKKGARGADLSGCAGRSRLMVPGREARRHPSKLHPLQGSSFTFMDVEPSTAAVNQSGHGLAARAASGGSLRPITREPLIDI